MFYTVYKTTNLINGKFYIGTHKTSDPNDSYLGSGTLLKKAIEKYGRDAFKKEVLFTFDNPADMFAKEAELVTEEFLSENNTYNLKKGGFGGFDHLRFNEKKTKNLKRGGNDSILSSRESRKKAADTRSRRGHKPPTFLNMTHSESAKRAIGRKNSVAMKGEGNSQFGTMWITDGITSRKVKRDSPLSEGWRKGRV